MSALPAAPAAHPDRAANDPPLAAERPWRDVRRELAHDVSAYLALSAVVLVVAACLLAPLYASRVAHRDPLAANPSGTTIVHGVVTPVLAARHTPTGRSATPIGPTWDLGHYALGADARGRDLLGLLLYAGRTGLLVAGAAALVCVALSALLALLAALLGAFVDGILARVVDVSWAFPAYLLALVLAYSLGIGGLHVGPVDLPRSSLWLPVLVVAVVHVPYVARPVRSLVRALQRREYVRAARRLGASRARVVAREILPSVVVRLLALFPTVVALCLLAETALSVFSVGVRPPEVSWGTMLGSGLVLAPERPGELVASGLLVAATAGSLLLLGSRLSRALDPGVTIRGAS
ncbi:MAG: ABC transporter permease subunit [Actinomycetota bacterium]|nr:ABC transporter permease subunit [Actinomycetota bacterium]